MKQVKKIRRRILYVTGTRADYELMRPVLFALQNEAEFQLQLLVTGMHLRKEFGNTLKEIVRDKFKIAARVNTLHRQSTAVAMTVSLGQTLSAFAKVLQKVKPDVVLLLGDRDEQLAGAIAAAHMNMIVAQVHAGERSGNIDESNRHAISRYAHLLMTPTAESRDRLIRMGEEVWRVHHVGAPTIDRFLSTRWLSREQFGVEVGVAIDDRPFLVLLQHSVTQEEKQAKQQIQQTLQAIKMSNLPCIAIGPNADAGSQAIRQELQKAHRSGAIHLITHLRDDLFANLFKHAAVLVGNSSSGIIETPYFALPVVNIGTRQTGRLRCRNIIDVGYEADAILAAIQKTQHDASWRAQLAEDRFVYGRGDTAHQIVRLLKNLDLTQPKLLNKQLTY